MISRYSPIVLFVFTRTAHTYSTLGALVANKLANKSDLIIYSDAARNNAEAEQVIAVRTLVHTIKGFRSVTIIERETNYGLARNIIEGVSEVCSRYGRVIVLEDDIVTSPHFLTFMNTALEQYADKQSVWHISGWNYPIEPNGLEEAFFWRVMNCWGWATWENRWKHFKKKPDHLIETWKKSKIKRFNLDGGYNFWEQVTANQKGNINTWAIFWYTTIFEHDGLCLNPTVSLVQNIGNDGTGENCGHCEPYNTVIATKEVTQLPSYCEESMITVDRIKAYFMNMQAIFPLRLARQIREFVFDKLGMQY